MKKSFYASIFLITLSIASCSQEYRSNLIDAKIPGLQPKISTTTSFENDGDDLRKYRHDMNTAISRSNEVNNSMNNYFRNVTMNGQRLINIRPNNSYLSRSKIIQNNDYYIETDKIYNIEKQTNKQNCWAACLQYMIMAKYGKTVKQESLIAEIKGDPYANNAASIDDMSKLMGYRGMQISEDGEEHLAVALGENQPVMIGNMNEGDKFGHARLIIGARYSFFVKKAGILTLVTDKKVFREFRVLDPWDQSDKMLPADEVIKDIKFLYSFNMNK